MRNAISLAAIVIGVISFGGCYYDNEEALYGVEQCSQDPVTYSTTISVIIGKNCLSCHSGATPSGGVSLESYSQVRAQAGNGNLLGVVTHASGFSPMPKNAPPLSACSVNAIRQWIDSGSPNN